MYHCLLIAAQFVIAAILVLTTRWYPIPWVELLVATPGIALAVWGWVAVGLREIRIHPSATDKTRLNQTGPYGFVRHPMYTGLLWMTVAILPAGFTWWRVLLWFALLIVLILKTREEEREMRSRFEKYAAYQDRVGGLLPKLW